MSGETSSAFDSDSTSATPPPSGTPTTWIEGRTPRTVLQGTSGNDGIIVQVGDITVAGGEGDDTYVIWSPATRVVERPGEGIDTVEIWTDDALPGYALPWDQEIENLVLKGTANAWAIGNALPNRIVGNIGNNLLDGGAGDDLLIGGGGRDLFVIAAGGGSDVIADFTAIGAEADRIRLDGTHFEDFAEIRAALRQVGTSAVLDLGDGETLTLLDTDVASLTAANFSLPVDTSSMVLTFADEFSTLSWRSDGTGTWTTRYNWGSDDAYFIASAGAQEVLVDPDFRGLTATRAAAPLGLNPFSLADGRLTITAAPVEPAMQPYLGSQIFTSGGLTSESSFAQTYGYFEISARLPAVQGAWPAFWLLPADLASGTEIDVFESLGLQNGSVHVQIHSPQGPGEGAWVPVGDITEERRYGVLWTPYELTFTVDGKEVFRTATPTDMHRPMYLLATLGMGGHWGGPAAPGSVAELTIDWIRAYQLAEYTLDGYTLLSSAEPTHTVRGTAAAEILFGTDGADRLIGRGGADTLSGGFGDDTYVVSDAGVVIIEEAGGGVDTVMSSVTFVLPAHVENLVLTGGRAINGTGNDQANIIIGNRSNNVIQGGPGNDILTGGGGKNRFVINRGDGSDIITDFKAGPGRGDVVELNGFAFANFNEIRAAMTQHGADTHLRLSHLETLVFRGVAVTDFAADDFALPARRPESDPSIRWYIGTGADEAFYGTSAPETFQSHGGRDTLAGGLGDDFYDDPIDAIIIEKPGEGIDTVRIWSVNHYVLPANVENLILMMPGRGEGNELSNLLRGSFGDDTLLGHEGDDALIGGGGDNLLDGGPGRDTADYADLTASQAIALRADATGRIIGANGLGGTDTLQGIEVILGGDGNDFVDAALLRTRLEVSGGGGDDTLAGGRARDILWGGDGDDLLIGNAGNDILHGGAGDDVLIGGMGVDRLTGGPGADRFVWTRPEESSLAKPDVILDFSRAEGDRIDLSAIDADPSVPGNQALIWVGSGGFEPGGTWQVGARHEGRNTFVDVVSGDGELQMVIRLRGVITLGAEDFIL